MVAVSVGRPGKIRLFSQRATEVRPYLNCVSGDALVATGEGLRRLDDADSPVIECGDGLVFTGGSVARGIRDVLRVETKLGYSLTATPDHRVRVLDQGTGELMWREVAWLEVGDRLVMQRGYHAGGE